MTSKAFDKVWHKGLLHKIKSYGVDSNLLSWFSSYLQDRQQRVVRLREIRFSAISLIYKINKRGTITEP
jgi:hypothetical protein